MKSTDVHVHVGYPSSIRRHHHCKHNGTDKSSALPLTTTLIKACMLKCDLLRYSAIAIHSSTILNTHTATMTTIAKFNQYRLLAMLIYPICQRTPTDRIECWLISEQRCSTNRYQWVVHEDFGDAVVRERPRRWRCVVVVPA